MFLPHERKTVMSVAPSRYHLRRPGNKKNERTNKVMKNAPAYTGPDVKGWSPQYRFCWAMICRY